MVLQTNIQLKTRSSRPDIQSLLVKLVTHDPNTYYHSMRVSKKLLHFADYQKLPLNEQHTLKELGLVHDIGKLNTPASILRKEGKLNEWEWAFIEEHPSDGNILAREAGLPEEILKGVLYHHENMDGSGYYGVAGG